MADSPFKGGRNNKAPYETTHLRVPTGIKFSVTRVIDIYKRSLQDTYVLSSVDFLENLRKFIDGYMFCSGSLANANRVVAVEEILRLEEALKSAEALIEHQHVELEESAWKLQASSMYLKDALLLKPNAGGAIKKEIRKALTYLG